MRSAVYIALLAMPALACKDPFGSHVEQLGVDWMEWRNEVQRGTSIEIQTMGIMTCGGDYVRQFSVDEANSAIVFSPYEIVPEQPCQSIAPVLFSDRITLSGLEQGTYTLRSGDRVFGELTVTADPPAASRLLGAGRAAGVRDPDECVRLRPVMVYATLPIENQSDTTSWMSRFVTGEIIETSTPVCGASQVFHLISRE